MNTALMGVKVLAALALAAAGLLLATGLAMTFFKYGEGSADLSPIEMAYVVALVLLEDHCLRRARRRKVPALELLVGQAVWLGIFALPLFGLAYWLDALHSNLATLAGFLCVPIAMLLGIPAEAAPPEEEIIP